MRNWMLGTLIRGLIFVQSDHKEKLNVDHSYLGSMFVYSNHKEKLDVDHSC